MPEDEVIPEYGDEAGYEIYDANGDIIGKILYADYQGNPTMTFRSYHNIGFQLFSPSLNRLVDVMILDNETLANVPTIEMLYRLSVEGVVTNAVTASKIFLDHGLFIESAGSNLEELHMGTKDGMYLRFGIDGGGRFIQAPSINERTTSSNPNVTLASDNTLRKSTSAKKYKEDIQKIQFDPKLILKIDPVSWIDKAELEEGNIQRRYFGLIADYVEAVGLGDYVTYRDGEVDGLMYDRLLTLLIPIVKEHEEQMDNINKIASLALTKVEELEKQIEELTK